MSNKNKKKENFWKRLVHPYDVVYKPRNEKFTERHFAVSRIGFILLSVLSVFLVGGFTVLLLFFTPLQSLMPGYVSPETQRQYVDMALRMDSLIEAVHRQHLYVMNIQDIFRGEVRVDSVNSIDSLTALRSEDLMERTERERIFTIEYEEAEKYNLTSQTARIGEVDELHFFAPVHGIIDQPYDPVSNHYGIDVMTGPDETVKAVLDGVVLLSGYTAELGYVVIVQHTGELVSVYKHLGSVLKRETEKIKAGEPIGIVGTTNGKASPIYLHFELWHKGVPLNPLHYIAF